MKKLLFFLPFLSTFFLQAQTIFPSHNISLVGLIAPNTTDAAPDNRRYSGCWGWYQAGKNKEYALSGTSKGTYFIDISAPATPSVCDYVEGGHEGCIWRELKTYSHYCYIISDDGKPNKFQIVDLQYLPDSVHLVYSSNTYFERAHTLWVDNDKLYVGGITYADGVYPSTSPMAVFSLANPEVPVKLRTLDQDISFNVANYVHDMYVRNDTIYASCCFQGLNIFQLGAAPGYSFTQLGSFTNYAYAGFNHSSSLTKDGKHLVFCDEEPVGCPIHYVDVENLSNIQPVQLIHPNPNTTPHNPYVLGNDFAVVACYEDGLHIYNISQPGNMQEVGYFDTYPQGGFNTGSYNSDDYSGNWGAYPFLPSGIIIAQDMQNGVFLLDGSAAFNSAVPVGITSNSEEKISLIVYPNPAPDRLAVSYKASGACTLQLKDLLGRVVYEKTYSNGISEYIDVTALESGSYIVSVTNNNHSTNKPLIIQH